MHLRSANNLRLALPLHAAGAATTEGTGERKVDVLLAVHTHHEAGDVHHLLANPAGQSHKQANRTAV
jgi:hypothetical protein